MFPSSFDHWAGRMARSVRSGWQRRQHSLPTVRKLCPHLHLEVLEERRVLSIFMVTSTAGFGPGTLGQAILDANARPGTNTIAFAIPGAGVHTITPASPLPDITNPVVIDGSTQPGFAGTPLIELRGPAGAATGLTIRAGYSTIQSLIIGGFYSAGISLLDNDGSNVVEGNYIGTDATGTQALPNGIGVAIFSSNNRVGGTAAGAGNLISGNTDALLVYGSSGNVVQGNKIGTDVTGTQRLGNALGNAVGVDINGPDNTVGGAAAGAGNLISNNGDAVDIRSSGNLVQGNKIGTDVTGTQRLFNAAGVTINGSDNAVGGTATGAGNLISGNGDALDIRSSGNVVQGNKIGTDVTGTHALPNDNGIRILGMNNQVGGTTAGAGNLISGNSLRAGVSISGNANVVQGNKIGTDVTGSRPLGNLHGVEIDNGSNNLVGGTTAGAGNTIAFNRMDGVLVNQGTGNAILRNAIFGNGNLGIELTNGDNHDQDAPGITSATSGGGVTTVAGTLQSAPSSPFVIEVFANQTCDPSGLGEGEQFLASLTVTTDSGGTADFTLALAIEVPPGEFVAATATDADGNTSAFSPCAEVSGPGARGRFLVRALVGATDQLSVRSVSRQPGNRSTLSERAVVRLFPPDDLDGFFGGPSQDPRSAPRFRPVLSGVQDGDAGTGWAFPSEQALDFFHESFRD